MSGVGETSSGWNFEGHQKGGEAWTSCNMPKGYRPLLGGPPPGGPLQKPCHVQRRAQFCEQDWEAPASGTSPTGGPWSITWVDLGFVWCCKRQATLSAKTENQNKMPSSQEHMHGDNKKKTMQTRRTGQWAHELQTGFQGQHHTKRMGSDEKLPFSVVVGDLTASYL